MGRRRGRRQGTAKNGQKGVEGQREGGEAACERTEEGRVGEEGEGEGEAVSRCRLQISTEEEEEEEEEDSEEDLLLLRP